MKKSIRVFMVVIAVFGLVIMARNNAAWAASIGAQADQSVQAQDEQSVTLDNDNDCDKDKDNNDDKCCGKDKDKKKCDGTVKPPDDDIDVCERGDFSVGGAATLDVQQLGDRDCLRAYTELPDPAVNLIPDGAGTILFDALLLELPASGGTVKICFAVPPGRQAKIYSSGRVLKTMVRNGIACAEVSQSGAYTLAGK